LRISPADAIRRLTGSKAIDSKASAPRVTAKRRPPKEMTGPSGFAWAGGAGAARSRVAAMKI